MSDNHLIVRISAGNLNNYTNKEYIGDRIFTAMIVNKTYLEFCTYSFQYNEQYLTNICKNQQIQIFERNNWYNKLFKIKFNKLKYYKLYFFNLTTSILFVITKKYSNNIYRINNLY